MTQCFVVWNYPCRPKGANRYQVLLSFVNECGTLFISESPSGTSCPYWETSGDCCTNCDINYGDCDSDNDCKNGLKCGSDNCPSEYPSSYDCCYLPECTSVKVSGNSYGSCDGTYVLTSELHEGKPIYENAAKTRKLATYGNKWACYGSSLANYFIESKYSFRIH